MNIPVGHNSLVVPLNAMAPGSVPLAPASAEGQKGSPPDFAALVSARPESIRVVLPSEPDMPSSQANADAPSDGAEGEGADAGEDEISGKEQTTGSQATADGNRDQPLDKGLLISADPLLPEALTRKAVPSALAPSADHIGQNGPAHEAQKIAPDAEKAIPVADTVVPETTNVPPVAAAPPNTDSTASQPGTAAQLSPASISPGTREASAHALSVPHGDVEGVTSATVLSRQPSKAQIAPNPANQTVSTSGAALQKPDTVRIARNEATLAPDTDTALQPDTARTAPLPPAEGDQPPLKPVGSGPEMSVSARREIAGTAARFSAFPAPESPAAPRVETGGSALGQAVQVPFRTASKSVELLHASPASAPVEMSYSEAPKRSGPDLLPLPQTSVSLAGPVPPISMGIQPQPLAGGFPAARAVEADLKSETISSLLIPSDTPELSNWDASRITATPPGAAGPLRSELAAHVARQLVDVMGQAGNRPVEITLSPEELGRVRMGISTEDGRIIVNILAERPDTLDLMRRHIDQLGQTFRSMGYDQVAFSFGRGAESGDQSGSAPPDGQASPSTGNAGLEGDLPSDAPTVINLDLTATRGIDIRL